MYYVYILRDKKTNKFYKGFTEDLKTRVIKHKNHKVKTTKNWDLELVYYEAFISKKHARIEEIFLKSGKGRERLNYLLK